MLEYNYGVEAPWDDPNEEPDLNEDPDMEW